MRYLFVAIGALLFHYGLAYKAAVIEYYSESRDTPSDTILKNLQNYRTHIEKVRDQGVEIIVFPEYGLTTLVQDPEEYAIDLANDTKIKTELSDMAQEHALYIVVNVLEKSKEDGSTTKYYNTNLVFNRNGDIIAKYRKINLNNEPKLTPGTELVTFATNFGVNFGLFTGADILHHNPSRSILEFDNVTDIIYPTAWVSTLPFYSSLTVQRGYAQANGVNLLAANYAKAKDGRGGSGIYLYNGKYPEIYIDSSPSSKPIVQDVTKIDRRQKPTTCSSISPQGLPIPDDKPKLADFKTLKKFDASDYTFKDVDLSKEQVSTTVCHRQFCCNFNLTIAQPANTAEFFKLMVYSGKSTLADEEQNIRVCSLLACKDNSKDSCGERASSTTKFIRISIGSQVESDNTTFYVPLTLNNDLRPIKETSYCEQSDSNNATYIQLNTYRTQSEVLVFGIYGTSAGSSDVNAAIRHSTFILLLWLVIAKFIVL
ncbi:vanin-like protein 1 -like [Asbolus verrucosus]|uniref:Vanin-like protein 1-like n=1 Tax=Asbolus verrucosus TaxID=1661398 RepID=A0A482VME5_ASBVE|nr:vanin-like protein 1 -like [Asbolus verrucosus]